MSDPYNKSPDFIVFDISDDPIVPTLYRHSSPSDCVQNPPIETLMILAPFHRQQQTVEERNATERFTMQQTIGQAAKLYGKARSTIHRAIASGRLSCSIRGDGVRVIDLSELIRLWGEPDNIPAETQQNATSNDSDTQQAMLRELQAMRQELVALREEVHALRTLPSPEQVATHPDDSPTPIPSSNQAKPVPVTTPAENHKPVNNFGDLLARMEARNSPH